MKKLFLLGVFALSMGVTLFVSTAPAEAYNPGDVFYGSCAKFLQGLPIPWVKPGGETIYEVCPYNARYFYEYDNGRWAPLQCPSNLYFCPSLKGCTYANDPNCYWGNVQRP